MLPLHQHWDDQQKVAAVELPVEEVEEVALDYLQQLVRQASTS